MNALSLYHAKHPELASLEGVEELAAHWEMYTQKLQDSYEAQQKILADAPEARVDIMRPFAISNEF